MEVIVASIGTLLPVLYTLAAAIGLDLITGSWAAWKSGTFNPEFLPTFFTSQVLTKATPILLGLVAGVALLPTSTVAAAPVIAAAGTAAATYLYSLVNSILSNIAEGQAGNKGVPTSVALNTPVGAAVVSDPAPPAVVSSAASPENDGDDRL
jgi:hypothetical protein